MRALSERPARHNTLDDCRCGDLAPAGIIRVGNGSEDPEVDRYVVVLSHRQFVEIVAMDDAGAVTALAPGGVRLHHEQRAVLTGDDLNPAWGWAPGAMLRISP